MMELNLEKADLVNLVSATCPDLRATIELEKEGLMNFTGNQWNENWSWDKNRLKLLDEIRLHELYKLYK